MLGPTGPGWRSASPWPGSPTRPACGPSGSGSTSTRSSPACAAAAGAPQPDDRRASFRERLARRRGLPAVNAEAATPSSVDITDYVAVIRRHWKLVVACGLGLMVLALAYSLTRPTVYVSRAQIALPDPQSGNAQRAPHRSTPPPSSRCSSPRASPILAAERLEDRPLDRQPAHPPRRRPRPPRVGSCRSPSHDTTARDGAAGRAGVQRRLHRVPDRPGRRTRSSAGAVRRRRQIDAVDETINGLQERARPARPRQRRRPRRWSTRSAGYTSQRSNYQIKLADDPTPRPCRRRTGHHAGDPAERTAAVRAGPQRHPRPHGRPRHRRRPRLRAGPLRRAGPGERRRPRLHRRAEPRRDPGAARVDALPAVLARRGARTGDDAGRRVPPAAHVGHDRGRRGRRQGHRRHQRGGRRGQVDGRRQPGGHARAERQVGCCSSRPTCAGRRSRACSRCRPSPAWSRSLSREVPLEETLHGVGPAHRPPVGPPPQQPDRPAAGAHDAHDPPAGEDQLRRHDHRHARRCSPWPTCSASPRWSTAS